MYYIGIDGGGTKTTAVLSDESGKELRTTRMGPGNFAILDRGSFAQLIRNAFAELLQDKSMDEVGWATLAFAGAGRPEEQRTAHELIRALNLANFNVMTDAEILYYSIFGDEPGILISAGTGSICLVKSDTDHFRQIGGWGYLLGDEGSGFDIGKMAIKTALNELSTSSETSDFTQNILQFYGLQKPENLVSIVYSSVNTPRLIASCAKLICDLAGYGDPEALNIIDKAAEALCNYAIRAEMNLRQAGNFRHKVAFAGSILQESSVVSKVLKQKIAEAGLQFEYVHGEIEPAAAGVLYALNQSGKTGSKSLVSKLKNIKF